MLQILLYISLSTVLFLTGKSVFIQKRKLYVIVYSASALDRIQHLCMLKGQKYRQKKQIEVYCDSISLERIYTQGMENIQNRWRKELEVDSIFLINHGMVI